MLKKIFVGWLILFIATLILAGILNLAGWEGDREDEIDSPVFDEDQRIEFVESSRSGVAERMLMIADWLDSNDPFEGPDTDRIPQLDPKTNFSVAVERIRECGETIKNNNRMVLPGASMYYNHDQLLRRYVSVVSTQSFVSTPLKDLKESVTALSGTHVILTRQTLRNKVEIDADGYTVGPLDCDLVVLELPDMNVVYRYHGEAEAPDSIEYRGNDSKAMEAYNLVQSIEYSIYRAGNTLLQKEVERLYSGG